MHGNAPRVIWGTGGTRFSVPEGIVDPAPTARRPKGVLIEPAILDLTATLFAHRHATPILRRTRLPQEDRQRGQELLIGVSALGPERHEELDLA